MIPARPRRRRLPLTPLIDVIFLLLLFFMLSSTFLRFSAVEVTAAKAGRGATAGTERVTSALLRLGPDGTVTLNGAPVSAEALPQALATLAEGGTGRLILTAAHGGEVEDLVALLEIVKTGPLPVVLAGGARGATP